MAKYKYKKRFRKRVKKSIFKSVYFWLTVLFFVLLSVVFYFVLFFDFFFIKNIHVSGMENNINPIIERSINQKFLNFSSKSIFLLKTNDLKQEITSSFPGIKSIKIKKKLPCSLDIVIEKRKPKISWCEKDYCFNVDDQGIAFEFTDKKHAFFYFQEPREKVYLGEKIIDPEVILFLSFLEKEFNAQEFEIGKNNKRINMKSPESWQAYFFFNEEIDDQVENLKLVLEEYISEEKRQDLEYIDLRFENRAYYKFK